MPQILNPLLLRPPRAPRPPIPTQISALRENHEPHRLQGAGTIGSAPGGQLCQSAIEAGAIGGHFPRHEDVAGEAEAEAYEGDVLY